MTFSAPLLGTTFTPISIKKQIKESSALVEGKIIEVESLLDESNQIITRVSIIGENWINLKADRGFINVYYPGGVVGNQGQVFEGSPKLRIGERVVLMLKNFQGKNWIQGMGLGKFSLKNVGRDEILVNQIFPGHPEAGQMSLKAFKNLAIKIKNKKFVSRFKDKYEINRHQVNTSTQDLKKTRKIASVEEEKQEAEKFGSIWLVFLLALLGFVFNLIRKKQYD